MTIISLPKIGASSVKEAGSYMCTIDQNSVAVINDRADVGDNDKLKEKTGEFLPPWSDVTPQIFCKFKTEDGRSISDRFQLCGFEHYDPQNKPTAEQKKVWKAELEAMGYKVEGFAKTTHRDTMYVCANTDKGLIRVPNAENTRKSLMRLAGMLYNAGIKTEATTDEQLVADIKSTTGTKAIKVTLEEKDFTGERRSDTKLFKISYGERQTAVTRQTSAETI